MPDCSTIFPGFFLLYRDSVIYEDVTGGFFALKDTRINNDLSGRFSEYFNVFNIQKMREKKLFVGYQFVGYQFVGYQFVGYQFVGCQFVGYQ